MGGAGAVGLPFFFVCVLHRDNRQGWRWHVEKHTIFGGEGACHQFGDGVRRLPFSKPRFPHWSIRRTHAACERGTKFVGANRSLLPLGIGPPPFVTVMSNCHAG